MIKKVPYIMKSIQIKRFLIMVASIVLLFCLFGGLGLWFFLKSIDNTQQGNIGNNATLPNNSQIKPGTPNNNIGPNSGDNQGLSADIQDTNKYISTNGINAKVKAQKYALLTNGSLDKNKLNNFMYDNINMLVPGDCPIISYKLADLDNDGVDEIGLIYEKIKDSDRYLMLGTLRWKNDQLIKDVEAELKKNDYNSESTEIIAGDIITGANSEFIFLQKGDGKTIGSRVKVAILFSRGFSDFYTQDAGYEIEVKDFDSDGKLEIYTSEMDGNSLKRMFWSKWDGKKFYVYNSTEQPIVNEFLVN